MSFLKMLFEKFRKLFGRPAKPPEPHDPYAGEAYGKAHALGNETEINHLDPERKLVRTRFWGLAELNVVHDDLKRGAALFYEEHLGVPGEKSHHWGLPKKDHSVEVTPNPKVISRAE